MSLLRQLVTQFTPTERKAAREWLHCPLHNKRRDCQVFYDLLIDSPAITDAEAVFATVYPGEIYKPAKYRQLEFQLLKRLEEYLAWDTFRRHEHAPDVHLLAAYRQRNMDDHRLTRVRRSKPSPVSGPEQLHFDYLLATEQYELDLRASRGGKADYLKADLSLEAYLLALRLRQTVTTLAHQQVHKSTDNYEILHLDQLLTQSISPRYLDNPFISLYALVLQLQAGPADEREATFANLTQRIIDVSDQLPADDQRTVLIAAINYGLRLANSGNELGIAATFTLYQLGLERGSLHHNGRLSIFAFNNILALALHQQQVEWATNFLNDHQHELPDNTGSEVLALGRARLALARNDDGDALFLLQQADFKDFIHHLTARVMQLKIYFRQDSYTLLHSHISSTRKLLSRKKKVSYHLTNYRNIFQLADAILRLPPGAPKEVEQLQQRIQHTDPCTERGWLFSTLASRQ